MPSHSLETGNPKNASVREDLPDDYSMLQDLGVTVVTKPASASSIAAAAAKRDRAKKVAAESSATHVRRRSRGRPGTWGTVSTARRRSNASQLAAAARNAAAAGTRLDEANISSTGAWEKAITPEGKEYWWNRKTRESRWDPPVQSQSQLQQRQRQQQQQQQQQQQRQHQKQQQQQRQQKPQISMATPISTFLASLRLSQYEPLFRAEAFDTVAPLVALRRGGNFMECLRELGVTLMGHRAKIDAAVSRLV